MVKRLTAPQSEMKILRWILVVLLILYIVGAVPAFNEGVLALFRNPAIKLVLLVFTVIVSYMDHVLGILLAIAYVSSVMASPPQKPTPLVAEIRKALQEIPLPQQLSQQLSQLGLSKPVQKENMDNVSSPVPSISQEFQKQQRQDLSNQPKGSAILPAPQTGCDPIAGYNAPYDCVDSPDQKNCLCDGVAVWDNELNAQGLNHPMGSSEEQVGATF